MERKKWTDIIIMWLMVLLTAVAAFFCVPGVIGAAMGKPGAALVFPLAGLVLLGAGILCLAALLRFRAVGGSYLEALGRMAATALVCCAAVGLLSVVSGLLSLAVYWMLAGLLALDQIKSMIDLLSSLTALLVLPLGIFLFWQQCGRKGSWWANLGAGFTLRGRQYGALLALCVAALAAGRGLAAVFSPLPDSFGMGLLKTLAFSVLGAMAAFGSKGICGQGRYGR